MDSKLSCDQYSNSLFNEIPTVDHVVVKNKEDITIFAINRTEESILLESDLYGFKMEQVIEHIILSSQDLDDCNASDCPDKVSPKRIKNSLLEDGIVKSELPAYSWNVIRIKI